VAEQLRAKYSESDTCKRDRMNKEADERQKALALLQSEDQKAK